MDLEDALVSFLPAGMSALQEQASASTCTRVAFLSERLDLKAAMQRTLASTRYTLTQVYSSRLVERAIEKGACDVAIVDIERRDEWPSSVFSRFDEVAADFPVILLCRGRHEILNYFRKAQHATDIVPYEAISNPRFLNLIEAAVFRAEITRGMSESHYLLSSISYT